MGALRSLQFAIYVCYGVQLMYFPDCTKDRAVFVIIQQFQKFVVLPEFRKHNTLFV